MARGKSNESNKVKKSSNTQSNRKRVSKDKKKPDAAVEKKSKDAAVQKKINGPAKAKLERIAKWETPENLILLEGWARDGLTIEQIAINMGFKAKSTLYEYIKVSSNISNALKKGKEVADYEVENGLFKKACGHKEVVKKPIKMKRSLFDPETGKKYAEEEFINYVEEEVYIAPDTMADMFWLKNRCPEKWREKNELKVEADVEQSGGVIMLAPRLEEDDE